MKQFSQHSRFPQGELEKPQHSKPVVSALMFITPKHKDNVIKTIVSLKNTKSYGWNYLFKSRCTEISYPLAVLINLSSCQVLDLPKKLKYTVEKRIHKKGNRLKFKNVSPNSSNFSTMQHFCKMIPHRHSFT